MSPKPDTADVALLVLQRTESFADVWGDLAASVGCRILMEGGAEEAGSGAGVAGVILAVGGAEQRAYEDLPSATAQGRRPVAAVGAEADHRLAASIIRAGAHDYFALPGDMGALQAWLEDVVDRARARSRARSLRW